MTPTPFGVLEYNPATATILDPDGIFLRPDAMTIYRRALATVCPEGDAWAEVLPQVHDCDLCEVFEYDLTSYDPVDCYNAAQALEGDFQHFRIENDVMYVCIA